MEARTSSPSHFVSSKACDTWRANDEPEQLKVTSERLYQWICHFFDQVWLVCFSHTVALRQCWTALLHVLRVVFPVEIILTMNLEFWLLSVGRFSFRDDIFSFWSMIVFLLNDVKLVLSLGWLRCDILRSLISLLFDVCLQTEQFSCWNSNFWFFTLVDFYSRWYFLVNISLIGRCKSYVGTIITINLEFRRLSDGFLFQMTFSNMLVNDCLLTEQFS